MNLVDDMQKYEERTESTLKRLHRNYSDLVGEGQHHALGIESNAGSMQS